MNLTTARFVPFTILALTAAGNAQDRPTQAPAATKFVVEAGETKLTDLIDRAAVFLQWNVLVAEHEMAANGPPATFRLQQRVETDRAGCEDLLSGLLGRAGFALTALDEPKRVYEVISLSGPRAREVMMRAVRRSPAEILARPNLKVAVTTVVQLKHINAAIATNALRPFVASSSGPVAGLTIGNVGNQSALLLSGMQDQVASILSLIDTCDVPPPPDAAPPVAELVESLTKRIEALEKKIAQPQAR